MHSDLSKELCEAHERAARLKKADAMLRQMRHDKKILEQNAYEYKQELARLGFDVYKLETKGASLLNSLFGASEQRIQKERAEALKARMKCSQAERELRELETCIADLESEKQRLGGADAQYALLYEQKKQALLKQHGGEAERVMELTEDINNIKVGLKDIREAIAAGENAMRYLTSAHRNLSKAKSWGSYDMAGGKLRSHLGKYNHVDSAVIDVGIAQTAIDKFRAELADLDIYIGEPFMNVGLTRFERMADMVYDRLITDWYAQTRIEGSLGSVAFTKDDVQNTLNMLKALELQDRRRLAELQSKLDAIVLGKNHRMLSSNIKGFLE